jgi:phenylacetate-CoA ligase
MTARHPAPGELDAIETASRDEITALQLTRLRATLQRAYDNVPHYHKAFDAKGVHPNDLKSLADLSKFPFTVKTDLRDNYPFGMFAVPRTQVARIHASSGTTGKPTVVGYTRNDIDTWADLVARSIRAAGGRAGDMIHVAYGYGLFTGGLGAHYGAERAGCTVIPMSGGQTEKQVQLIQDFKPEHHHGHAQLHAGDHRAVRTARPGRQRQLAEDRHLRRRAVDRGDAPRHRGQGRHRCGRHLRFV